MRDLKTIWHGFAFSWKHPRNWFANLKEVPRVVKAFIQRGRYGVSTRDCWNLDGYILDVMKNGLLRYKKDTNGHPIFLDENQWQNVIDRMIYLIDVVNIDATECWEAEYIWNTCGAMEGTEEWKETDRARWIEAVNKYADYQQECLEELCDLMKQYLVHLWW